MIAAIALAGVPAARAGNPGDWLGSRYINFDNTNRGAVYDASYGATLLPDGGVLMVGRGQPSHATHYGFGVVMLDARLFPNGNFGSGSGKRLYSVEAMPGGASMAVAVTRQLVGKFVVCGRAYSSDTSNEYQVAVLRIMPDGTPDSSFGTNGRAIFNAVPGHTGTHLLCRSVVTLTNGSILVAGEGYYDDGSSSPVYGGFVARLDANGTLDPNFSGNGTIFHGTLGSSVIAPLWYAMAVDSSNRIYLAGHGTIDVSGNPIPAYLVARLHANGSLDTSYTGGTGFLATNYTSSPLESDAAYAIHLLPDNSAYVAGADNVPDPANGHYGMSLLRLTADGFLQGSFGTSGRAMADFQQDGHFDSANALTIQPDGSIVLAGTSSGATNVDDLALARFNPDGTLDTGFGNYQPGMSLYSTGKPIDVKSVVFSPRSGELIVTGSFTNPDVSYASAFMASRFEADDTELIFADGFE